MLFLSASVFAGTINSYDKQIHESINGIKQSECHACPGNTQSHYAQLGHRLTEASGKYCKEDAQCTKGNAEQTGTATEQRGNTTAHGCNFKAAGAITVLGYIIFILIII